MDTPDTNAALTAADTDAQMVVCCRRPMFSDSRPRPLSRRTLCSRLPFALCLPAAPTLLGTTRSALAQNNVHFNVSDYDRPNILAAADRALKQEPETPTRFPSPVKGLEGGAYYSEDVAWWPVDGSTSNVFSRQPGRVNPRAFTAHQDAAVRMNGHVAACVAAWRLTGEQQYAKHAMAHLRAWFMDEGTRMLPHLEHAGAKPGEPDGSPHGVEETVMLAETARAASFLCAYNGVASEVEAAALRKWFGDFALWLNESKKGFIARETKDRLAICWTLQAAAGARFAKNDALLLECLHRFRDKLLRQMNFDGQFSAELQRPDAYAASIFTLDCLSVLCETLSSPMDRLWDYTLPDGRGMRSAIAFLFPSLENRAAWKLPADAEHFSSWPARQPTLLLAGRAYDRPEYIGAWKRLPIEPGPPTLLRYFPVRQASLWTVRAPA